MSFGPPRPFSCLPAAVEEAKEGKKHDAATCPVSRYALARCTIIASTLARRRSGYLEQRLRSCEVVIGGPSRSNSAMCDRRRSDSEGCGRRCSGSKRRGRRRFGSDRLDRATPVTSRTAGIPTLRLGISQYLIAFYTRYGHTMGTPRREERL